MSRQVIPCSLSGRFLPVSDYLADFDARQWKIRRPWGTGPKQSWKLERLQHFREPGFPSWDAFDQGDPDRARDLLEAERDFLSEFQQKARELDISLYRVRVVERPITAYLWWELHLLKLRAECGERIRVVELDKLQAYEQKCVLPELLTLGTGVLYEIRYDQDGVLAGAVRVTRRRMVTRATRLMRSLYDQGENVASFVDREVAPLKGLALVTAPDSREETPQRVGQYAARWFHPFRNVRYGRRHGPGEGRTWGRAFSRSRPVPSGSTATAVEPGELRRPGQ